MNKTMGLRLAAIAAAAAWVIPASAQIAPPNAQGVSYGHVHMFVNDPEPLKKLFVGQMGGFVTHQGVLEIIRFPGAMIIVTKSRTPPTEGADGSSAPYFTFKVKNYADMKAKLTANGATVISDDAKHKSAMLGFPEKINVQIMEDAKISAPAAFASVRLQTTDPEGLRAWYARVFPGGVSGKKGKLLTQTWGPGTLEFEKVSAAKAATKGRTFDHIGFELKDLESFYKGIENDKTVVIDQKFTIMAPLDNFKMSYIVDPSGTRIELTQGFIDK